MLSRKRLPGRHEEAGLPSPSSFFFLLRPCLTGLCPGCKLGFCEMPPVDVGSGFRTESHRPGGRGDNGLLMLCNGGQESPALRGTWDQSQKLRGRPFQWTAVTSEFRGHLRVAPIQHREKVLVGRSFPSGSPKTCDSFPSSSKKGI